MSARRTFVSWRRWRVSRGRWQWRWRRARPTTRRRLRGRRRRWRRLDKRPRSLRRLRGRRRRIRPSRSTAATAAAADVAFRLPAVVRLRSIGAAFPSRPLVALGRNTILPPIEHDAAAEPTALRRLLGEVVEGVGEVLQPRQLADGGRNLSGEAVVRHIQLLQLPHAADLRRQRPLQVVEAHIKHRQLLEHPNLRRQTTGEVIVHQNQLVQRLPHLPNAGRNTTAEIIIRQNQHRNRRVPQILRNAEPEPVVIQEQSIQILIENLRRNTAFEVVKPQIQKLQRRQRQHHLRKPSDEPIVTQIQLEQQLQLLKARRNNTTEPIRVDMEQRQIGEEP